VADASSGTSVAALIVSIASATVALLGFAASLWLYRLSGARLKVQLVFCYAEDGRRTWSTSGRGRPAFADIGFDHMSPFGVEYGRVRVTNIGRTAVSVENISYQVQRPHRWTLRRHRATLIPTQFMHKEADPKETKLDLSNPIRLEPGDNVTADLYLWPALASDERGTGGGAIRVRGSAHAVGRKWATRSKRRYAWTIPAGAWTYFTDVDVTPELRVFRELWAQNHRKGIAASWALMMYRHINKLLAGGATREDIQQYLDEGTERLDDDEKIMGNAMTAWNVHHLYHHGRPPLWPEPKQPPPSRLRQRLHRLMWGHARPPWVSTPDDEQQQR
jgi:hypothetical protein